MADQRHRTTVEIQADTRGLDDTERYLRRAFDARHVEAFTQAVKKATSELASMRRQGSAGPEGAPGGRPPGGGATGASSGAGRGRSGVRGPGAPPGGGGAPGGRGSWFGPAAIGGAVGGVFGYAAGRASQAGALLGSGGALRGAIGSVPIIGPFAAGALEQADELFQTFAAQRQQLAEQFGALGLSNLPGAFAGQAQRLGLERGAAAGAFGRIAGRAGLTGEQMGGQAAARALLHQRALGVDTSAILGAAGTAGGEFSQQRAVEMMEDAITGGFIAGFRESKISDFVEQTAASLTEFRSRGILISPASVMSLSTSVATGLGRRFQGEAGARAVREIQGQMSGLLDKGGMGGTIAIQAVRDLVKSETGRSDVGFVEAQRILEGSDERFSLGRVQRAIFRRVRRAAPSNEQAGVIMLRNMFPGLSWARLSDAYNAVGADTPESEELGLMIEMGGAQVDRGERFRAQRAARMGSAFETSAAVAARVNRRAALGGRVEGPVLRWQMLEDQISAAIVPAVAGVADQMQAAIKAGDYTRAAEVLANAIGAQLPKAMEIVEDIVEKPATKVGGTIVRGAAKAAEALGAEGVFEDIFGMSTEEVRRFEAGPTTEKQQKIQRQREDFDRRFKQQQQRKGGAGVETGPTSSVADDLDAASQRLASAATRMRENEGFDESQLLAGV